jgi:pantoate--beta-alanine ligase
VIQVEELQRLRSELAQRRAQGRVAFVPTMGNLHAGHLMLVREARRLAETVVVSIFVNPMQFGANEDLDKYPRTLAADRAALEAEGVDLLFFPSVAAMYPKPLEQQTRVEVPGISGLYCGASRPGHFVGVATVVCKLFNMVQPDVAIFGKKDFQQLLVIRRMVEDLAMPIRIVGVATAREPNGLAMSSRNRYLTEEQRRNAPLLQRQLLQLAGQLRLGERDTALLRQQATETLDEAGFVTDYIDIVDADTLQRVESGSVCRQVVILAAAQLGDARLIDNIEVDLS